MNNGYSGTGISIIFYLILALVMPLVHIVRVSTRHNLYMHRFVLRHFFYGIMIIMTVVVGISWLITATGMNTHAHWHAMLIFSAVSTVGLLVLWVVLPLTIKLFLWAFDTKFAFLAWPIMHPYVERTNRTEYEVIDGVMSGDQWVALRAIYYVFKRDMRTRRNPSNSNYVKM